MAQNRPTKTEDDDKPKEQEKSQEKPKEDKKSDDSTKESTTKTEDKPKSSDKDDLASQINNALEQVATVKKDDED
jgi:hypothetical protein